MATKPSSVPLWNTGGANNVGAPSGAKIVLGWLIGERPPSTTFNWLQKLTGEWLQYLSDGAFTGAASFANAVTMAQTLAVTGASTLTGAVSALSTLAVTGLITATAGLTAAANQHITVSGTGRFKHGDMVKVISPVNGVGSQWALDGIGLYMKSSGAGSLLVAIPVDEGERLKSLVFGRIGDGAADITSVDVYTFSAGGTPTNIITGTNSVTNPAASWADTTVDLTDTTIASGTSVWALITANAAGIGIGGLRFTYDRP